MRYDEYRTLKEYGVSNDVIYSAREDNDFDSSIDDSDFGFSDIDKIIRFRRALSSDDDFVA